MRKVIIPITSVHKSCQLIDRCISREEIIDLLNAYIKHNNLEVEKVNKDDTRSGREILCNTIDEFDDAHQLDFIGQAFDAKLIAGEADRDFVGHFLKEYKYKEVQQELFSQLVMFSSDTVKKQQEFADRLRIAHPEALNAWNDSIDQFRSHNYSDSGNDIRKTLEFLLRDLIGNKTSVERQVKGPSKNILKSNLGKYLSSKGMDKVNIEFLIRIIISMNDISNEKFKHGEPTGLSEKDLRFYMKENFLIMQRLLEIEEDTK